MLGRSRQLLAIDLTRVDPGKGAFGVLAVVIAVAVVAPLGLVGEAAGLARMVAEDLRRAVAADVNYVPVTEGSAPVP
jgi:hypothetical protein